MGKNSVDYRVRQKSGSKKRYAYEFMSEGLNMLKSGKRRFMFMKNLV